MKNIIIILLLIIGFEIVMGIVKNKSYSIEQVNNLEVKACMVDMQADESIICD
jgi:hypothetical protein